MSDDDPELWPVPRGNSWGYVDREGREVIPADRFTGAAPFSEGLAAVKVKGKTGFIDGAGRLVIEAQLDSAGAFSCGLASVSKGRRKEPSFYIDRGGQRAFPGWFLQAGPYVEGRAVVAHEPKGGGRYLQSWLDLEGKPMLPFEARQISPLSEGLAAATDPESGRWGYLDPAGQWHIPPRFEHAGAFVEGLAVVVERLAEDDLVTQVIDRDGEQAWRYPAAYLATPSYHEGLLLAPMDPEDSFAKAFVDRDGQVVIPPSRAHAGDFHDGRARILSEQNRVGFIDRAGRVVVAPVLAHATDFDRGLARVGPFLERPGTQGLIDVDGRWVWPPDAVERGYPDLSP